MQSVSIHGKVFRFDYSDDRDDGRRIHATRTHNARAASLSERVATSEIPRRHKVHAEHFAARESVRTEPDTVGLGQGHRGRKVSWEEAALWMRT